MQIAAIFLFYLGLVFALIVVHECGHYLAGRIGGIATGQMPLRLFTFPQHVVLRSGDQWIAPTTNIDRYVELVWEYLKTKPKVYRYVAGGFLLETLFTVTVCVALILAGYEKPAWVIAAMLLMLGIPWLINDPIAISRGKIVGDLSGLWFLSKWPTLRCSGLFLGDTQGQVKRSVPDRGRQERRPPVVGSPGRFDRSRRGLANRSSGT